MPPEMKLALAAAMKMPMMPKNCDSTQASGAYTAMVRDMDTHMAAMGLPSAFSAPFTVIAQPSAM